MEFTLNTSFNTFAKHVYDSWLSTDGHTKMTGGQATASSDIGFEFTAWDEYISGKNLTLEKDKRIVQSWRTSEFDENEANSQIEVILVEKNGITELTLHHTNVPDGGEHYKKGWEEHYFQPMKKFFENK